MKDKLLHILKSSTTHRVAAFVAGASIAAPVTYFALVRKQEAKYAKLLDEEIQKTKRHYQILAKEGEASSPVALAKQIPVEKEAEEQPRDIPFETVDPEVYEAQVQDYISRRDEPVEEGEERWYTPSVTMQAIMDREEAMKTAHKPFPIGTEDFFENRLEYHVEALTYWIEDDSLLDDAEDLVYDADERVGEENLQLCEQLSEDGETFFVQNDKTRILYQIDIRRGSLKHEVAGFDDNELRHSRHVGSRKQPRFYNGD